LVENGLFFVQKKSNTLTRILDARKANQYFRKPPTGHNSSSAALGELRVPAGGVLWTSQFDVRDFFYRLRLPTQLQKYFGLPGVPASLLRGRVPDAVLDKSCAENGLVCPVLRVLPMGFSWAFYLAQESLRCCVLR
jgi:hypothetical protein